MLLTILRCNISFWCAHHILIAYSYKQEILFVCLFVCLFFVHLYSLLVDMYFVRPKRLCCHFLSVRLCTDEVVRTNFSPLSECVSDKRHHCQVTDKHARTHTHTHTHRERETERVRQTDRQTDRSIVWSGQFRCRTWVRSSGVRCERSRIHSAHYRRAAQLNKKLINVCCGCNLHIFGRGSA